MSENGALDFFETLVGFEYDFYGVDDLAFCIGIDGKRIAFKAVEDPDDGYRSYLSTITIPLKGHIFFSVPLARVVLEDRRSDCPSERKSDFSGWELVDVTDGHVWLSVGTDYSADYYPCFTFHYAPKESK